MTFFPMASLRPLFRPSGTRPLILSSFPILHSPSPSAHRPHRRFFSESSASDPSNLLQLYISHSTDPLLNLSLEHRLLQTSHPDSTVLLLYANAPSVIFGRNQNPWLETNLNGLLSSKTLSQDDTASGSGGGVEKGRDNGIQLVRRRSGGGTVFHDAGNVNFSVICPPEAFDRDRHAEMVVRALSKLGRPNTRVNERHDIVMDTKLPRSDGVSTFKISGSAYKLTRLRALHHGTCLLRSPNLGRISGLLRSPAEAFIQARGVDSVRSPVANVDVDTEMFKEAVVDEFKEMYGGVLDISEEVGKSKEDETRLLENDGIRKGYEELQSRDWIYGQTPKFTFCTEATEEDPRQRPALPFDSHLHLEAKRGIIEHCSINRTTTSSSSIIGAHIHDITDWTPRLAQAGLAAAEADALGRWMNGVMGTQFTTPRE